MPDPISILLNIIFQTPVNLTIAVIGLGYVIIVAVAHQRFFDLRYVNFKRNGQSVIYDLKGMWSYNLVYGRLWL
jgi:UDP-N-acetyl-D-mannosaminuronate dehydrogenase